MLVALRTLAVQSYWSLHRNPLEQEEETRKITTALSVYCPSVSGIVDTWLRGDALLTGWDERSLCDGLKGKVPEVEFFQTWSSEPAARVLLS